MKNQSMDEATMIEEMGREVKNPVQKPKSFLEKLVKFNYKLNSIISLSLIVPLTNSLSLKLMIGSWTTLVDSKKVNFTFIISLIILVLILLYDLLFISLVVFFYIKRIRYGEAKLKIEDEMYMTKKEKKELEKKRDE